MLKVTARGSLDSNPWPSGSRAQVQSHRLRVGKGEPPGGPGTPPARFRSPPQAQRAHPDEVADGRLHGGHGRGEVRDGFAVHLAFLVHDHQVRDLLRHWLQDALNRARVKHRHRGGERGGEPRATENSLGTAGPGTREQTDSEPRLESRLPSALPASRAPRPPLASSRPMAAPLRPGPPLLLAPLRDAPPPAPRQRDPAPPRPHSQGRGLGLGCAAGMATGFPNPNAGRAL